MNLDFLKEQSIELTEDIQVADTDEIINAVIEQKRYSSLAYQICEVAPIHGPTGATFTLVYDEGKVKLLRGEVTVEDDAIEDTGFTVEALQDLKTQFGKSITDFVGKVFCAVSATKENISLIAKMSEWSEAQDDMLLTDPKNPETTIFEIQQRVAEILMKINEKSYKSLDSFVVLPAKVAASMLAVSNRLTENQREVDLFLGVNSRTDFYLNPDVYSKEIFVGIKSKVPGQSSMTISPYQHSLATAVNPETGETNIFNINRYAITESRLSEHEKMLYKFKILNAGSIPNEIPIADGGGDITITLGDTAYLDGTNSYDPDDSGQLTYKWTLLSKPTDSEAEINNDTASTADITPDIRGDYEIQLVVCDGEDYSEADKIIVKAE